MRTVVGFLALGWVLETSWALALVIGMVLTGVALLGWVGVRQHLEMQATHTAWKRVEPQFEPWTGQQQTSERTVLLGRIEELERELRDMRGEVKSLQACNGRLERDLQVARAAEASSRSNSLFRRVGLDQDAPEWVAVAVRRAYRKRLHPDAHTGARKEEAERRFKLAEEVFNEIWRVRGFQF